MLDVVSCKIGSSSGAALQVKRAVKLQGSGGAVCRASTVDRHFWSLK